MPRFSVSLLVSDQSSWNHAPYFGITSGKLKSPMPISYSCVIGVSAARFHVSTLNGSGKIEVMLAGTGPPRAVMMPMQLTQLVVPLRDQRYSPPIFTSCRPCADHDVVKSSRIVITR